MTNLTFFQSTHLIFSINTLYFQSTHLIFSINTAYIFNQHLIFSINTLYIFNQHLIFSINTLYIFNQHSLYFQSTHLIFSINTLYIFDQHILYFQSTHLIFQSTWLIFSFKNFYSVLASAGRNIKLAQVWVDEITCWHILVCMYTMTPRAVYCSELIKPTMEANCLAVKETFASMALLVISFTFSIFFFVIWIQTCTRLNKNNPSYLKTCLGIQTNFWN